MSFPTKIWFFPLVWKNILDLRYGFRWFLLHLRVNELLKGWVIPFPNFFFRAKNFFLVQTLLSHNFLHTGRNVAKFCIMDTYCSRSLHFWGYFIEIFSLGRVRRGYPTHAKLKIEWFWGKCGDFPRIWAKFDGFAFQKASEIEFLRCKSHN